MTLRNTRYYFKEGINGFFSNGLMSLASVIIVSACLLILGLYIVLSVNVNYITEQLAQKYEVQVFIDKSATAESTKALGVRLKEMDNILDAKFVSKEEALKDLKLKFDKDSHVLDGFEDDNPLRDSYIVTLENIDLLDRTVYEIRMLPLIANIKNNKQTLDNLTNLTNIIKSVSFWLMLLFSVIAIFIISNTIRLTLANRKREINIMKFIGATDFFIKTPFIIEGLIISFIAVIITMVLLTQGYGLFIMGYSGIFGEDIKVVPMSEVFTTLLLSLSAMSVVLSGLGSAISIRRYLQV